jgi:hypothetical protein
MEPSEKDYSHINGWGIDADPRNEPTYPMKHYTGDDHQRINWERPELQSADVEMLHSNERPSLSAVFGTSSPPSGLSGMIRRYAFRHSENEYTHWLPLILADRVNMVEGIIEDFMHGKVPNVFMERGWNAEWKYNRKSMATKLAVGAAVAGAVFFFLSQRKQAKGGVSDYGTSGRMTL